MEWHPAKLCQYFVVSRVRVWGKRGADPEKARNVSVLQSFQTDSQAHTTACVTYNGGLFPGW